MRPILILPGLHDSDSEHWQSRWQARDEAPQRVTQDDWETPRCVDWVAKLDKAIVRTGPDTVLVAHSAACALVAHGQSGTRDGAFTERFWLHPVTPRLRAFLPGRPAFRRYRCGGFDFEVLSLRAPTIRTSRSCARKHSRPHGAVSL